MERRVFIFGLHCMHLRMAGGLQDSVFKSDTVREERVKTFYKRSCLG